jgi:hypothetical protein
MLPSCPGLPLCVLNRCGPPGAQICIPEWSFFNRDPEKWLDPAVLDAAAAKKSKKPKSKSKKSKDKKKA